MKLETKAIHIGQEHDEKTGAVIPPIYATSTFAQLGPGETRGYDYTRSGNPNFTNLEQTLASIEHADFATVFSSGMAAITAVISTLKSGDIVLAEENIYGCTYRIFDKIFKKFGIVVQYLDFTSRENYGKIREIKPALVWIESPTNPLLKILDIKKIGSITRNEKIPLLVDNTFASSYFQRPLELGADISLSSSTKYLNGHSDCLGGVVMTNSREWQEKLIFAQKAIGLNPSPFDAWLISRGVKTIAVRMKAHHENALRFAEFLETQSPVKIVRYPFLSSHPQHSLAIRQMFGGSGIVTADLDLSLAQTKSLLSGFKLFSLAESLGGVESLVCHPASMTHSSIPKKERVKVGISDGLVRFSLGIEHSLDLIEDYKQAIRSI